MLRMGLFFGEEFIGGVNVQPQNDEVELEDLTLRITHFSQPSSRCHPLAVLQTITSGVVCFKMISTTQGHDTPLFSLYSACLRESKTAVMPMQNGELHLVAMPCRNSDGKFSCFWGYSVASGLYSSVLYMLNRRCLGIVFDLDETLLVANTLRSFDDKIEALHQKMKVEIHPHRISYITAEIKRYEDDRDILRLYSESDEIVDNGKVISIQSEAVPSLSGDHPSIIRPLIRLQNKNIILTRINPMVRDTSILVRLRPAWDDLKRYLTTDDRKRFEVYVCTMADRDYALEMWRLLDPDFNIIATNELMSRIVCVKSGSRKSLFNVFEDGNCDSKLSLVIDDRLNVWDENDQAQVHVVPAFTPYCSPEEENNGLPVLCIARNVACRIRGYFFKYFDDGFRRHIHEISYEDDVHCIPSPPSVAKYLDSKESVPSASLLSEVSATTVKIPPSLNVDTGSPHSRSSIQTLQVSPAHPSNKPLPWPNTQSFREAEHPTSGPEVLQHQLDPDERRRLLILHHGQCTSPNTVNNYSSITRSSVQNSIPGVESSFLLNGNCQNRVNLMPASNRPVYSNNLPVKRNRPPRNPFFDGDDIPFMSEQSSYDNGSASRDSLMLNNSASNHPSLSEVYAESGWDVTFGDSPPEVLRALAVTYGVKVQFRPMLIPTSELQFFVEVWFGGERIGEGTGRTRKEAQCKAAECSLQLLECASQMSRDKS